MQNVDMKQFGAALFNAFNSGHPGNCTSDSCAQAVVAFAGRFFITFGHAGYNSPANNRNGYRTAAAAMQASNRYRLRGMRARGEA